MLLALGQVLVGGLQGAQRFTAVGTARVVEVLLKVVLGVGIVALLAAGLGGLSQRYFRPAAATWSLSIFTGLAAVTTLRASAI